ncbi:MAG TPA: N-formylglutamate amidohydrolase [Rhizomicrobium sp.]|nr:N-formylglutamate amidohydrolase [Rhizomicrobium sp.]
MTDLTGPAFERIRGEKPLLFLCDHAGHALPAGYGTLGLKPELFETHIAYDIGAAEVTRRLAATFGAPAVLGVWSRLLIDLNRGEDDPTLIMKLSDGSIIPGNRAVDEGERERRIDAFHAPYHRAIAAEIARLGQPPLISLHSFTPTWKGVRRRWEVGVLWDKDGRLARPLLRRLAEAGFIVGDNEPYSGALEGDTMNRHGTRNGLPHVLLEMRQDLVGEPKAAGDFANRLKPIIEAALADMGGAE